MSATRAKSIPLFCVLFLFLFSISPVQAEENEIDVSAIPSYFADKLHISIFAGGIIATGIVLLIVTLPIIAVSRGKNTLIAIIIIDFVFLCACIGMTWCPYWILIIIALMVALGYATKFKDLITGR